MGQFQLAVIAAVLLGASGAFAQQPAVGACGQPVALTGGKLVLESPPVEVAGVFTRLTRNEPRYVEIEVKAPMALTITTLVENSDTTLILFDSMGNAITSNDDQTETSAARIVTRLDPGSYCAQVDIIGTLDAIPVLVPVTVEAAPPPDACIRSPGKTLAFGPGSDEIITTGALDGPVDQAFTLADGVGVTIAARSPMVDTFLTLEDEYGRILATDDDSGGDSNSLLELGPMSGERLYCLRLTALNSETGIYALSIQPQPSGAVMFAEPEGGDAEGQAARQAEDAARQAAEDAAQAAEDAVTGANPGADSSQ